MSDNKTSVSIRAERYGKVQTFERTFTGDPLTEIPKLVEYFEGSVGIIFSIHDAAGNRLYQGLARESDVAAESK